MLISFISIILMSLFGSALGMACARITGILKGYDSDAINGMSHFGAFVAALATLAASLAPLQDNFGDLTLGQSILLMLATVVCSALALPALILVTTLLQKMYSLVARLVDGLFQR